MLLCYINESCGFVVTFCTYWVGKGDSKVYKSFAVTFLLPRGEKNAITSQNAGSG